MAILRKYLDTPEKQIGSFGGISGLFSSILAFLPSLFPDVHEQSALFIAYTAGVILALGSIIAYLAIMFTYQRVSIKEQAEQINRAKQQLVKYFNAIAHNCRDTISPTPSK